MNIRTCQDVANYHQVHSHHTEAEPEEAQLQSTLRQGAAGAGGQPGIAVLFGFLGALPGH
jgi:hypothetical protein